MANVEQLRLWLYALFACCLLSAPMLFVDIYLDAALKIAIALSAIALVFSLLILLANYNSGARTLYMGVSMVGAALCIGWTANILVLFWPQYQAPNFLLNAIQTLVLPASLIAISLWAWSKRMSTNYSMGLIITMVIVTFVLIDVANFFPQDTNRSDVIGYRIFSWIVAVIGILLLVRQRITQDQTLSSQTTYAIAVIVILTTFTLQSLQAVPDAELLVAFSLARTIATFLVCGMIAHELLWVPNNERDAELRAMTEQYKQLRRVIDQLPAGLLWKDRYSRFLGGNTYFLNALGLQNESELVGLSEYDLRHGNVEEFLKHDRSVMDSGIPSLETYERYRMQGETMTFNRISRAPLRDDDGNIYGLVAFYTEIEQINEEGTLYRVKPNDPKNMQQFYGDNLIYDLPLSPDDLTDEQMDHFIRNMKT